MEDKRVQKRRGNCAVANQCILTRGFSILTCIQEDGESPGFISEIFMMVSWIEMMSGLYLLLVSEMHTRIGEERQQHEIHSESASLQGG